MKSYSLWILLLCVALLSVGHGLHGSMVAISASGAEFGADVTGFIMSGYSAGMLLSAMLIPKLVRNVGHVRAFAGLASIVSTVVLLVPLWQNPWFWFLLRFVAGLCTSGLFIVCESWLNSSSSNNTRGRVLSLYMIVSYGSLGLGQLLLNVADPSGFVRFIIVSALLSLSLVPLILLPAEAPSIEGAEPVNILDIWRASPLAVVGSFANGLGQSAFFAMGTYFALGKGLSVGAISLMMALPPLGVIISQYPIGWASDRIDRRMMIFGLSAAGTAAIASIVFLGILPSRVLIGLVTAFGVLTMPVYSLVVAHANDHISKEQILGASGRLVLLYGMGSILGPLLVGQIMRNEGPNGFPAYLACVYGGLALFAAYRMYISKPALQAKRHSVGPEIIAVSPTTTPVGVRPLSE
jgi:MFS family permease